MSKVTKWHYNPVRVQARLVPRFFWTTASIDVFLANRCILRTGGEMRITGSLAKTFTQADGQHTVRLTWGAGILMSFPYRLEIDGEVVSDSRVPVENWQVGLVPAILVSAALLVVIKIFKEM